jgi:hypothetical protein
MILCRPSAEPATVHTTYTADHRQECVRIRSRLFLRLDRAPHAAVFGDGRDQLCEGPRLHALGVGAKELDKEPVERVIVVGCVDVVVVKVDVDEIGGLLGGGHGVRMRGRGRTCSSSSTSMSLRFDIARVPLLT